MIFVQRFGGAVNLEGFAARQIWQSQGRPAGGSAAFRQACSSSTDKGVYFFPGGKDEQSTSTGRNKKGRIHPHFGRDAQGVERRRAAFRGVGDLPRERLSRRSGPAVRFAKQRLVRANHPAF